MCLVHRVPTIPFDYEGGPIAIKTTDQAEDENQTGIHIETPIRWNIVLRNGVSHGKCNKPFVRAGYGTESIKIGSRKTIDY